MTAPLRERLRPYKFSLLLVALLFLTVAPILTGGAGARTQVSNGGTFAVFTFAALAVLDRRRVRVVAIALGVLATVLHAANVARGTDDLQRAALVAAIALLALIAAAIVGEVLRSAAVTWDKIQGAICAYLLFGVVWSLLYRWILLGDPDAIRGAVSAAAGDGATTYFSFVTLTTLGYGDIAPVSPSARTLAWLEAAFGQIYLTVLVARLVSLHLAHRADGAKPG